MHAAIYPTTTAAQAKASSSLPTQHSNSSPSSSSRPSTTTTHHRTALDQSLIRSVRAWAMAKHPRDDISGAAVTLSLSLALGGEAERARKQPRRDAGAGAGEFVCKTCSRAFASFQALGGHRTSHLRGRHGLALGLPGPASSPQGKAAVVTVKKEKPAAAAAAAAGSQHECHFCGAEFEMGQALGGHMRRHREEAAATARAPPVLLQLFV